MKKFITILVSLSLYLNSYAQWEPWELDRLRNSTNSLTGFPEEWISGDEFVDYLVNKTLGNVYYPTRSTYWGKSVSSSGTVLGVTHCNCVQTEDAYIEFGDRANTDFSLKFAPESQFFWPSFVYDPLNPDIKPNATDDEYKKYIFTFYKALVAELLAQGIDFTQITKLEILRGLEARPIPQPVNVGTVKIWYKKCIKYDCDFFGI